MRWIVMICAGLLVGCVTARAPEKAEAPAPDPPVAPTSLNPGQTAAVRTFIVRMMKDPESVRHGRIVAGREPSGRLLICGEINAKNSYGGYTGMLPYVVHMNGSQISLYSIASRPELAEYVYPLCTKRGLHIGL